MESVERTGHSTSSNDDTMLSYLDCSKLSYVRIGRGLPFFFTNSTGRSAELLMQSSGAIYLMSHRKELQHYRKYYLPVMTLYRSHRR